MDCETWTTQSEDKYVDATMFIIRYPLKLYFESKCVVDVSNMPVLALNVPSIDAASK
jgi:hypothetical protein